MKHLPLRMPVGGIKAQGILNLLGRPELSPLDLLVRESAQNAWDARLPDSDKVVEFQLRIRTLSAGQSESLRGLILSSEPELCPPDLRQLARSPDNIDVLEISDFGTVGLRGPTNPMLPVEKLDARFVNFFFDYGKAHAETNDGGTFGYGRSSLYLAGSGKMVVVDSLTAEENGTHCRRVMACHVGSDFEVTRGANQGRYSGIHLWVSPRSTPESPAPLEAQSALDYSRALGMPERTDRRSGTSVLIPWIDRTVLTAESIVTRLIHHLWPKMVPANGVLPMRFNLEVDGVKVPIPDPRNHPVYRLYALALQRVRTKEESQGVVTLRTKSPRHDTGYLAVEVGVVNSDSSQVRKGESEELQPDLDELSPDLAPLDKVVFMRPAELVVRYQDVPGASLGANTRWAGVFVCADTDVVRNAFARSEPPAHDNWHWNRLSDRSDKTIVGKTVRDLIPAAIKASLGIGPTALNQSAHPTTSLAAVSAHFSELLLSGPGSVPGQEAGSGERGKSNRGGVRTNKIKAVRAIGLDMVRGRRVAVFEVVVSGVSGNNVRVAATPKIVAEGKLESVPEGIELPKVCDAPSEENGESIFEVLMKDADARIKVAVQFGGDYAIELACRLIEDDQK